MRLDKTISVEDTVWPNLAVHSDQRREVDNRDNRLYFPRYCFAKPLRQRDTTIK